MLHLLLTIFTIVELNCENLFDCRHDSLKNDLEFCEGGARRWNPKRYWHKVNNIGKELISCGGEGKEWYVPDLIALVEVENDSVVHDLTHRSLLRNAGYEYFITNSPDQRGIDVALLYHPFSFQPDTAYSIRITPPEGNRPTRDILYVRGRVAMSDDKDIPLHVFVVHAPSRSGGKKVSEPYRLHVSSILCQSIDSVYTNEPDANIIVMGDFNDYYTDKSIRQIEAHKMRNVSAGVKGTHGAAGTYRFRGEWGSLDHIFLSHTLADAVEIKYCRIHDKPFLWEEEPKYGGIRPKRTYQGFRYNYDGFSDHFPLVLRLEYPSKT